MNSLCIRRIRPSISARGLAAFVFSALAMLLVSRPAVAQDTRTVTEPVFPPSCTVLNAELTQTGNQLPSADESDFDTSRIQSALNDCTSGQAVELALGSNGSNAFLIQPITLPAGVTLLIDAGVTVYGSRDPRDYDAVAGECGTIDASGNGCNALITVKAANAGIMGYGVIDGRGGQTLIGTGAPANTTWWQLSSQAQTASLNQNNPRLVNINANNFTLYKITLQNSPMFHVNYSGNGLTVWDVKIIAPGTARNTDGIDPGPAQNVTITNSYIGDGDDNIALKPGGNPTAGGTASNMSITHNHFYVGHGMSIGSQTSGGSTNVLIQDLNIDGDPTNSNDTGIRIKTESSNGGLIDGVTYKDVCMTNVATPITFNPFYSSSTGSDYPQFENIVLSNVTILTPGTVQLEGYSSTYPLGLTLDNVNFSSTLPASDVTASNANITLGPGPVNIPLSASSGSNITLTNNVTSSESPYSCNSANFPTLAPEFFASASAAAPSSPITLTAIFEPTIESPTTLVATEPTGTVTFYDGATSVGAVTLSGSTDLATLTLSSETAGAHTYSATYSGDTNYSSMTTGAATVTVTQQFASSTALTASPTTINAGQPVTLTATVTGSGAPTGTVTFLNGATALGTASLNANGVATLTISSLAGGTDSITASYAGSGAILASTSTPVAVTVEDFAITASPSALNIEPGSSGSTALTFASLGGLTGTVSYTCSGSASYVSCGSGGSANLSGTSSATATVTVSIASTTAAGLLTLPFLFLFGSDSKSQRTKRRLLLLAGFVVLTACTLGLTGCTGGGSSTKVGTPPPTIQTATVTATVTTAAGAITHTAAITVNVQ